MEDKIEKLITEYERLMEELRRSNKIVENIKREISAVTKKLKEFL
jgi:hypothetical protein